MTVKTDRCSEYRKMLITAKYAVTNLKVWNLEDCNKFKLAEMTFMKEILKNLFDDEDVHVFDDKMVSEETPEMIAMQGKIDIFVKLTSLQNIDITTSNWSLIYWIQGAKC